MFIVALGNAFDGITVHGPFNSQEERNCLGGTSRERMEHPHARITERNRRRDGSQRTTDPASEGTEASV